MKQVLFISSNMIPVLSGDSILSMGLAFRLEKQTKLTVITFGEKTDWEFEDTTSNISNYHVIARSGILINKVIRIIKYGSVLQAYSSNYINSLKSLVDNNQYDYIIIDHLRSYSLFKSISKKIKHDKTKVIYMAHNLEYLNHEEKLKQIESPIKRTLFFLANWKIQKNEKSIVNEADILWGLSQSDIKFLSSSAKVKASIVIPPYFPWKRVKKEESLKSLTKNILILGSMQWYPNVLGALHFIDEVFPKILEMDSAYKLFIVGQKPDKRILDRQSEKIIVTGKVVSVDPYIANADLLVIPNRSGSGIKIKVLESLVKGLPVIMYSENAKGYDFTLFKSPFVVNSPTEFANSVLSVNKNYQLKSEVVKKSIELFDKYSNFDFNL